VSRSRCASARRHRSRRIRAFRLTSQTDTWFLGVPYGTQPRIITDQLFSTKLGQAYTKALTASGLAGKVRWKKLTKLPRGLKLNPRTGVIFGTPKKATGTFTFTVALVIKVKVKGSPKQTTIVQKTLTLTVTP
jgi:hypothetical protein